MKEVNLLGALAMDIIADYPLYAKTSGITYDEAIGICKVLYPEPKEWAEIVKELE